MYRLSFATDDIPQCPQGTPVEECVHTLTGEFLVRDSMHRCSSKSDADCSPGWNEHSDVELLRAGTHCHARAYTLASQSSSLSTLVFSVHFHSALLYAQRRASTRRCTTWTPVKSSATMSRTCRPAAIESLYTHAVCTLQTLWRRPVPEQWATF